ncbi:MAG: hypothetical protein KGO94_01960 [Alphaproteobacteria bacterium]|nr:hypothetical protein [Alphaproteobacteria bacterium]
MTLIVQQTRYSDSKLASLIHDMRHGSTLLWRSSVLMLTVFCLFIAVQVFDGRLINGINAWDKPAKFALAIAAQFLTVSWAMNFLPRITRGVNTALYLMAFSGLAELAYISARAGMGLTSHFNSDTVFAQVAYGLMGVGAVTMTAAAFFIGFKIWRQPKRGLWAEAAALGLMVGAVLGTIAGGYMSAQTGHWVGGEMSDARGIGFFQWSTTGGDLRVAHFVGLHAAQFIPLAALSGDRRVVYGVGLLCIAATALTFGLAVMGVPIFVG